ncbi:hypothetical protein [Leptospira haakeii]|uniref:Porin n=1 Tax=Leptospira haakeii TaxID=2023198 RepID=A0ABX4PIQ1_9LEPT|nr:hypothetical protein [Leptospira haakeii]PKA15666.1 hypothetical protein CH363_11650 [Leptospira haakeii]PKA21752.1 hypothetical protein CH377_05250 [Leptospira haakeii]
MLYTKILISFLFFNRSIFSQDPPNEKPKEKPKEIQEQLQTWIAGAKDENGTPIQDFFFGSSSAKRKMPKYFSIYPGFNVEEITVDISGKGNEAIMSQVTSNKPSWLFDLKSKEFQISEWIGVHLLVHNSDFYLDKQVVQEDPYAASDPFSEDKKSSNKRTSRDVGTRMNGNYSMAMPVIYVGRDNEDSWRFGLGFGPANVRLTGTADFFKSSDIFTYTEGMYANRTDYLNQLSMMQFYNGNINFREGDPVVSYLLANLSQGNNLELLGLYYASKGLLNVDPFLLFFGDRTKYSDLELVTLNSLARSQVNVHATSVFSYMIFIETGKLGFVKFRLALGGPIFKQQGYTYEFRNLQFSAYMPIEF